MKRIMGLALVQMIVTASALQANGPGEAQVVTWDDVEGLRLSSVGYRATDDPCRRAGETDLTVDWLDHTADLVACPAGDPSIPDFVTTFAPREVGRTETFILFSVPRH